MFDYIKVRQHAATWTASCTIDENLPCLQGHFPDRPVLPAIAQLEMLIGLISHVRQAVCVIEKASVLKFIQPISPLDTLTLALDVIHDDAKFTIHVGDKLCTRGKLMFRELV